MFKPRPRQIEVLSYRGGRMGVSAVPGSGKTHTLSALAADIIARGELEDDQEVLIVTLVNSAVENFSQRVGKFIEERGLLPHLGYRVRTLHGLAHDIVRERPALVGLADDFQIIDEHLAEQIRQEAGRAWLQTHGDEINAYLDPELDENQVNRLRFDDLPALVDDVALGCIRQAKDRQLTPEQLRARLDTLPLPLPLAEMGSAVYADYQRALAYRGAIDFDDLIRLALQALSLDEAYLERQHRRWPFILEDEAQDSSRLQEEILKLLTGVDGNWVRVGDPNQAIYETFTTASPQYLRAFLQRPDVTACQLPNSGRSTRSIIRLANYLVNWTMNEHPLPEVRHALDKPLIKPVPRRDPQPNPADDPGKIYLIPTKFTPENEILAVADSLARWLPEHSDATVAVLAPRNARGFELVEELKRRKIDYVEILQSSSATRAAAGALMHVLNYLSDPQSASKLAMVYRVWRRAGPEDDQSARPRLERVVELLRKCRLVEDYLWPRPDRDWLDNLAGENPAVYDELLQFRPVARRWQGLALLPVDQVILTLAQELFTDPTDLAVAHKLAVVLRRAGEAHLEWRLPELAGELALVANNARRFLGFSDDDQSFDPERYKGKVVVATIHKAKGLEWDRVYLMSANGYDFPSGVANDKYISERWFVRNSLNLQVEALAQLDAALSTDEYDWYEEGAATRQARLDYISERLRLFYVGITRAEKELVITWNTGRRGDQQPSIPFVALQTFWEEQRDATV